MQDCSNCKNYNKIYSFTWFMNKEDCSFNIQRESEGFDYPDCPSYEQENNKCTKQCNGCHWQEKEKCLIYEYPIKIWKEKCRYYLKQLKNSVLWKVKCTPDWDIEDGECCCYVYTDKPKEIYKLQDQCIDKIQRNGTGQYSKIVPYQLKSQTLEEFKNNIKKK